MCGKKEWSKTYTPLENPVHHIVFANKTSCNPEEKGDVEVVALIQGKWVPRIIRDVLHVSGIKNLFSQAAMVENGYTVTSDMYGAVFYKDKERGPESKLQNNMFIMKFLTLRIAENSFFAKESLDLWHQRLGHVNISSIIETNKRTVSAVIRVKIW